MKARFGLVLNWAFVALSSAPQLVVEEESILIQEGVNILGVIKMKVQIEFFLHPTV